MPHYPYLIIGGGMAADAAARGIREVDGSAPIGIVGSDPHPPYNRPPLSKALWKGDPVDGIWRHTGDVGGVTLHLARTATALNLGKKEVVDDHGDTYGFERLLLATGGSVRRLPYHSERVIYFRTFDDYQRLRSMSGKHGRFVVIGGGFIGSEIAAALAMTGEKVTMVFPESGLAARVFPADLSRFLVDYYVGKGIEVLADQGVVGLEDRAGGVAVALEGGGTLEADAVVAGIGIQPNTMLAERAGLAVGNGVVVDERLRTSAAGVYAAGDLANFPVASLGGRIRVEHEDNANTMGRVAGQVMAGADATYSHLPMFYSDLFDVGDEAVGELDPRMETVTDWKEPFREGVIYYLKGERVRGVLLWNTWGQVDAARALIGETGPFRPGDLLGRLPG